METPLNPTDALSLGLGGCHPDWGSASKYRLVISVLVVEPPWWLSAFQGSPGLARPQGTWQEGGCHLPFRIGETAPAHTRLLGSPKGGVLLCDGGCRLIWFEMREKLFIYFIDFGERKEEINREKHCLLHSPSPGIKPTTFA